MTPAMYTQNRLLCGGGVAFCAAVVVQLLQVTELSTALWVALGAAAGAIPLLAAVLMAYATHDRFTVRHDTEYIMPLLLLGLLTTVACAAAVFWHFAWWAGVGFLAMSLIAFVLGHWDYTYHQNINPPTSDDAAKEQPQAREASS
jgi:Ca2+/Na+ antiporter